MSSTKPPQSRAIVDRRNVNPYPDSVRSLYEKITKKTRFEKLSETRAPQTLGSVSMEDESHGERNKV